MATLSKNLPLKPSGKLNRIAPFPITELPHTVSHWKPLQVIKLLATIKLRGPAGKKEIVNVQSRLFKHQFYIVPSLSTEYIRGINIL